MRMGSWVGPAPIAGAASLDEGGLELDLVRQESLEHSMVSHPVFTQAMLLNTFLLAGPQWAHLYSGVSDAIT